MVSIPRFSRLVIWLRLRTHRIRSRIIRTIKRSSLYSNRYSRTRITARHSKTTKYSIKHLVMLGKTGGGLKPAAGSYVLQTTFYRLAQPHPKCCTFVKNMVGCGIFPDGEECGVIRRFFRVRTPPYSPWSAKGANYYFLSNYICNESLRFQPLRQLYSLE